jgi:tripartite-type tricarboxylate transporter receptor subunit TctC
MLATEAMHMRTKMLMSSMLLTLSSLQWIAGQVHAQQGADYPRKPVRLVVPFAPGGPVDIIARSIAPRMSESLGQQLVVDNRAGAGSTIGSELVAKSPPDGYTLLMVSGSYVMNAQGLRAYLGDG